VRPVGRLTRGTTNPNRLRRVDNWTVSRFAGLLRSAPVPLVVDLGYGETPITTVELYRRLSTVRADVRVVGLEIDPVRVAQARSAASRAGLDFALGGFELAGLQPVLVRAMNVLRQYDESEVDAAWTALKGRLAPDGMIVEGTCDELGRLGSWVCLDANGPRSLTLAARLSMLERPATLAERLPKALIHHNVPGERVHELLRALDRAWLAAAPYSPFGPRQRWVRAVAALRGAGWPVLDRPNRWRLGELTVDWQCVAPVRERGSQGAVDQDGFGV
jgi:hypothetical protein